VDWPDEGRNALPLAYAIVESTLVDMRQCETALKVHAMSLPESKLACARSLQFFVADSRQRQGVQKLLTLARDPAIDAAQPGTSRKSLTLLKEVHALSLFIRERLLR